jgi:hypothetical protein
MNQIRIEAVSGSTPILIYVADVYGNNQSLIGTITNTSVIPPAARFYPPSLFSTAPAIMLKLIDSSGCEKFVILECTEGCGFDISVQLTTCVVNISVTEAECNFDFSTDVAVCTPETSLTLII